MESHLALLSTISSPHLRRITLTFNVVHFVRRSKFNPEVLARKEWGTADGVFLWLAAKSREVIQVIVLLMAMKPPSSVPECGRFLARFREVGKVQVRFLRNGYGSSILEYTRPIVRVLSASVCDLICNAPLSFPLRCKQPCITTACQLASVRSSAYPVRVLEGRSRVTSREDASDPSDCLRTVNDPHSVCHEAHASLFSALSQTRDVERLTHKKQIERSRMEVPISKSPATPPPSRNYQCPP